MSHQIDFRQLESGMKKVEKDFQAEAVKIIRKCATSYAKKASLYVPPGDGKKKLGTAKIDKKLYYRPILYLPEEVRDPKNKMKDKDLEALKSGMLFKVVFKKRNKTRVMYFKRIRAAKKYMRIKNRGLFKVSFGSALESIGELIPSIIRSLMSKSKNLFNLTRLNKISESRQKDVKLTLSNEAYDNEPFAKIAIREGDKAAAKTLKNELRKAAKEVTKI